MAGKCWTITEEYQYLGFEMNLKVGTFFSGLIDDVRIYNRAVSAEKVEVIAQ